MSMDDQAQLRHRMEASGCGSNGVAEPKVAGPADPSPSAIARARWLLAHRAALDRYLDRALFADPAFDMLLFLFARPEDDAPATTSDCCAAARVPRSTALRWIQILKARALISSAADPGDKRVTLIALTEQGRARLGAWLDHVPATMP